MNLFKNWQKKKSKKKLTRKFELLKDAVEQLIEKFTLSSVKFYDWLTHKDISKHINISLYISEGIRDGK